jgi:hypothetical protein
LCGVVNYASAQALDFLDLGQKSSFLDWKHKRCPSLATVFYGRARINEYQMSNEGILSIIFQFKRKSAAIPSFGILRFDIRYFTVRCLNPTRSRSGRI